MTPSTGKATERARGGVVADVCALTTIVSVDSCDIWRMHSGPKLKCLHILRAKSDEVRYNCVDVFFFSVCLCEWVAQDQNFPHPACGKTDKM